MGGGQSLSQEEINIRASQHFSSIPDNFMNVGIDESLLKYSGIDSAAQLEDYSSQLLTELGGNIPDYVEQIGSSLVDLAVVPNAVGVGALVISMILQICFIAAKGHQSDEPSPADLLRRVFAEEKSSEVRDLMEEYVKRYKMHLGDDRPLLGDSKRLEEQLSIQITRLKNSMLADGHMSSRALRYWTNGAAFHAQMLIHVARLKKKEQTGFLSAKSAAVSAIETYNTDLSDLLDSYKAYKISSLNVGSTYVLCSPESGPGQCGYFCTIADSDSGYHRVYSGYYYCYLSSADYINYRFPIDKQIKRLKSYFSNIQSNVGVLIDQQGNFKIPAK